MTLPQAFRDPDGPVGRGALLARAWAQAPAVALRGLRAGRPVPLGRLLRMVPRHTMVSLPVLAATHRAAAVGQDPARVHVYEGWFEDTIPTAETGPVAVLHVDADWYGPVRLALEAFYPRLASGGALLLNDYGRWPGCDRATHEVLGAHGLGPEALRPLGPTGAVLVKP